MSRGYESEGNVRQSFNDISSKIKKNQPDHKPVIMALEGFVGAGKSTLAAKLKAELGDAYVVEIDDFFLNDKVKDDTRANVDRIDRKRLEEQVLLPIKNGQSAAYQRLEYPTDNLSDFIKIPDVQYLIIEGISSFHPSIADYMDYKIWVDAPRDVADARGVKRDKERGDYEDELWQHWASTYQDYVDLYHPEVLADFTVDNSRQV